MASVIGLGGIFFKSERPDELAAWYREHLGIALEGGFAQLAGFDGNRVATNVFAIFDRASDYFAPPFMLNLRVDDLDGMLSKLRAEGVWVDDNREDGEFGKFGWIRDLDDNRIELWEPPLKPA